MLENLDGPSSWTLVVDVVDDSRELVEFTFYEGKEGVLAMIGKRRQEEMQESARKILAMMREATRGSADDMQALRQAMVELDRGVMAVWDAVSGHGSLDEKTRPASSKRAPGRL